MNEMSAIAANNFIANLDYRFTSVIWIQIRKNFLGNTFKLSLSCRNFFGALSNVATFIFYLNNQTTYMSWETIIAFAIIPTKLGHFQIPTEIFQSLKKHTIF